MGAKVAGVVEGVPWEMSGALAVFSLMSGLLLALLLVLPLVMALLEFLVVAVAVTAVPAPRATEVPVVIPEHICDSSVDIKLLKYAKKM